MFALLFSLLLISVHGLLLPQEEQLCEPSLMYKDFVFGLVLQRCQELFCENNNNNNNNMVKENITSTVWLAEAIETNWRIIYKCVCFDNNNDGIVYKQCLYPTSSWLLSTFAQNEQECKEQQLGQNYTFYCDPKTGDASCHSDYEWLSSVVANSSCNNQNNLIKSSNKNVSNIENQTSEEEQEEEDQNQIKSKNEKTEQCQFLCGVIETILLILATLFSISGIILLCIVIYGGLVKRKKSTVLKNILKQIDLEQNKGCKEEVWPGSRS